MSSIWREWPASRLARSRRAVRSPRGRPRAAPSGGGDRRPGSGRTRADGRPIAQADFARPVPRLGVSVAQPGRFQQNRLQPDDLPGAYQEPVPPAGRRREDRRVTAPGHLDGAAVEVEPLDGERQFRRPSPPTRSGTNGSRPGRCADLAGRAPVPGVIWADGRGNLVHPGGNGTATTLPPLPRTRRTRWPCSSPRPPTLAN